MSPEGRMSQSLCVAGKGCKDLRVSVSTSRYLAEGTNTQININIKNQRGARWYFRKTFTSSKSDLQMDPHHGGMHGSETLSLIAFGAESVVTEVLASSIISLI